MKNKNGLKILAAVLVVALIGAILLLPRLNKSEEVKAFSILSAQAEQGEIRSTFAGGGVLTTESPVEVSVPQGVEVTKLLVSNGAFVSEGDALAEVDRVSVMSAITQTQETLNKLEQELNRSAGKTTDKTLSAPAAGRVKAIYVQPSDDVEAVMLSHGALAVLSLDGLMALEIDCDAPFYAGDAVTVTTSDGKKYPGRVESARVGKLTVTLTDEGPLFGDTAKVTAADGSLLGSGILRPHSEWLLLASSGTVATVSVREEAAVNRDTALVKVEAMDAVELQQLSDKHREYEALLTELFRLYETGAIAAPCAGFVSGADEIPTASAAATGASASSGASVEERYAIEWVSLCSLTPDDSMTVTITVDELDILRYRTGMEAEVTVDALPGQSFSGVVTEIGAIGVNHGGTSKYTVTLSLDRAPDMLEGMNASVVINGDSTGTVLTIPIAAIQDEGSHSYVYTAYDSKAGQLTTPVEVVVGASDGDRAEILSGLAEGATVWYAYYDIIPVLVS